MAVKRKNPQPDADRQTIRSLVLGVSTWFLHLNAVNALTSVSCKWHWLSSTLAGISALQWVVILLTLTALILLVLMISGPWRIWRGYQARKAASSPRTLEDTEKDRRPLAAFITVTLNSFFVLFVLAAFIPVLTLRACGQG